MAELTRAEYVNRLLDLGRRHGDVPTYGSDAWEALPNTDPRRFAAVVRAAEAWRLDGTDEAIARRVHDEEFAFIARLRAASHELSEAMGRSSYRPSWPELARRRELTAPERTATPWTAAELDPARWQESHPPSTAVPYSKRFARHDDYYTERDAGYARWLTQQGRAAA